MTVVIDPIIEVGNEKKTDVIDRTAIQVLGDIVTELKIMNLHLAKITNEIIEEGDLP